MHTPLGNGGIAACRVNKTLHGRSVYRKQDVPHHNVVKGYSTPGTGDAVDLFCASGTPVYAMHDGTVSRVVDPGGRLSCLYVANAQYTTIYAHLGGIPEHLHVGDRVTSGEQIGVVGDVIADPHLHLEMWENGKAISASTPSGLAAEIRGRIVP